MLIRSDNVSTIRGTVYKEEYFLAFHQQGLPDYHRILNTFASASPPLALICQMESDVPYLHAGKERQFLTSTFGRLIKEVR